METPTLIVEVSFGTPPKIDRAEKWERLPLHAALASHHERSTRLGLPH